MKRNFLVMVFLPLAIACLAGCVAASKTFGQAGPIGVMYFAPAWGPGTNGEEVVYFLKQVTMNSRDDEQTRIYFCSVKPDGTCRREIAQLWKDDPDQYFETFAVAVTMDVNAATKRAAIGVELGDRGGVFILNLDGTGFRSLWPKEWKEDRPSRAGYPTWSPDGQWLAFQEYRFEKGFNLYRIVKCKSDASGYMPLTDRNEINFQPAWSPKGDMIAYVSDRIANAQRNIHDVHLWLMKTDGSEKHDLKAWGNHPRWSPDGKLILHDGIVLVDPSTGSVMKRLNPHPPLFPKWGNSGYVFVGPDQIGFTTLDGKATHPLLKNILRRGSPSDMRKESFRW